MTPYQVVVAERSGKPGGRAGVNLCKTEAETLMNRFKDEGKIAWIQPCSGLIDPLYETEGFTPIIRLHPLEADRFDAQVEAVAYCIRRSWFRDLLRAFWRGLCGK